MIKRDIVYTAIIDSNDKIPLLRRFSSTGQRLLDMALSDPESHFIIDDSRLGILTMKYFEKSYFRNALIYHTGDKPKYNTKTPLRTIGNFTSESEVKAAMLNDAFLKIII